MHVAYSDGSTPAVYYSYDADGNRLSMTDGTGQSTYTYDVLGRLTHAVKGHGQATGYGYDLAGEQTRVTYPNGYSVVRAFDNDGRLGSVSDWLGNTTGFGYDADGDQTSTMFPASTGETDVFAFDAVGAVSSVSMNASSGVLASVAYTRDAGGQVTGTGTVGLPGAASETDVYDQNSRLTQSGGNGYGYDAADDPTQVGSSTNTFDTAGELTGGGGVGYSYDQLGERTLATPTSGPATNYGYDQAGNLTSVSRSAGSGVVAISDTYAFDGDGLRASQSIGGSSSYLAWDKSMGLPLLLDDGQNSYIYGPGGVPFEQVDGAGNVLFLHHDQQGSTRMLTGTTGAIQATFSYDAYGNPTGSTGTASTPLGYDGQYTDKDTGLIYLRARSYDPTTTQFLSVDPLVQLTQAPYLYADDNPIDISDPSGLESLWQDFTGTIEEVPDTIASGQAGDFLWNETQGFVEGTLGVDSSCLGPGGGFGVFLATGRTGGLGGDFSTFQRGPGGQVDHYTTYTANPQNPSGYDVAKRFDRVGRAHFNKTTGEYVPTPHTHDPGSPGGVRPPNPDEIPIEIP